MVFTYISINYLRDENNLPHPTQRTAKALLSSIIADTDTVITWIYYVYILLSYNKDTIPQWLLTLQLICCIVGTISWITIATDGRFIDFVIFIWWRFIISILCILAFPIILLCFLCVLCVGQRNQKSISFGCYIREIMENVSDWMTAYIININTNCMNHKLSHHFGKFLFMGIVIQNIPQLIITLLIQGTIRSIDPDYTYNIMSSASLMNIIFSALDILHKLSSIWDLQMDVQNVAYNVMQSIQAHDLVVYLLAITSSNHVISVSGDGTAKLWDIRRKRCIQSFQCESLVVYDVLVIGTSSKVITACHETHLSIFDYGSGVEENRINLGFIPHFIVEHAADGGKSLFTSGENATSIEQRTLNTAAASVEVSPHEIIFQYHRPATSMTFASKDSFVSTFIQSKNIHIWKINRPEPVQTLPLEFGICTYGESVLSMSYALFLAIDGDTIKSYIKSESMGDDTWLYNGIFRGHYSSVQSLTKVNDTLFLSNSVDTTAKLWNIDKETCLFTFQGNGFSISSCVYLKEQQSVATGDFNGMIKVWPIAKYLRQQSQDENDNDSFEDHESFEDYEEP